MSGKSSSSPGPSRESKRRRRVGGGNPEYYRKVSSCRSGSSDDCYFMKEYLLPKLEGKDVNDLGIVKVVENIYNINPHDIEAKFGSDDVGEWTFCTRRDREYERQNPEIRVAPGGFWKVIDEDKPLVILGEVRGFVKTFSFMDGKTEEMFRYRMYELRADAPPRHGNMLDDWVLCRIHNPNNWRLLYLRKCVLEPDEGCTWDSGSEDEDEDD